MILPAAYAGRLVHGILIVVGIALLLGACAKQTRDGVLEPAALPSVSELQALQQREYDADHMSAFASTLSAFQDLGYFIEDADQDSGFISALSPLEDPRGFNYYLGVILKILVALDGGHVTHDDPVFRRIQITATVEPAAAERSTIRLAITTSEIQSYGGPPNIEDSPAHDARSYQFVFNRIEDRMFMRQAVQS